MIMIMCNEKMNWYFFSLTRKLSLCKLNSLSNHSLKITGNWRINEELEGGRKDLEGQWLQDEHQTKEKIEYTTTTTYSYLTASCSIETF